MSPEELEEEIKGETKVEKQAGKKTPKSKKEPKELTKEEIIAAIKDMTVMDLADLVKTLESEFGISAAPVVVGATSATSAAPAAEAPPEEEKTEFSVVLKSIGEKKIEVIKAVREVTTLGLKQAKDLVEAAPQVVKEGISKDESNTIKQKLEAAGAVVAIS